MQLFAVGLPIFVWGNPTNVEKLWNFIFLNCAEIEHVENIHGEEKI